MIGRGARELMEWLGILVGVAEPAPGSPLPRSRMHHPSAGLRLSEVVTDRPDRPDRPPLGGPPGSTGPRRAA